MKKIFTILLVFSMSLSLMACSSNNVSKEDYDSQANELQNIKEELSELQKNYESKTDELQSVKQELSDLKLQETKDELSKAGAVAWAETVFGKNIQIIIHDNDLYINIPTGYTISQESIKTLWKNVRSGLTLYAGYYKQNPEQLPYDSVTIIVLEENTGLDMLSFQFLKNSDNTFTETACTINISNSQTIIPYLSDALK